MGDFNVRGPELKKLLKLAKKQPLSFAYTPGGNPKDDYFGLDKRKPGKTIYKASVQEGAGQKGAFGKVHVDGKLLCLTCERELPNVAKRLKKLLKLEKVSLNVPVMTPEGAIVESDIEELPDDDDEADCAELSAVAEEE